MNLRLAIVNQKGGVGKTTTAVTLAHIWRDRSPLLIDAEEGQGTKLYDHALKGLKSFALSPGAAAAHGSSSNDIVIFDCPASLQLSTPVLQVANMILIPVVAALSPLRASIDFAAQIEKRYPDKQIAVLLTQYQSREEHARDVRDAAREYFGDRLLTSIIPASKEFNKGTEHGQTIDYYAPLSLAARAYRKAALEIEARANRE